MEITLRNSLAATLMLGLMTGNALADDLAGKATNPISNLIQFQLQDQYNFDNANDASGYSNAFLIQPVVPFKLKSEAVPLMITRTTIPYVSTPDLGNPNHRKHGLGDTTILALGLPKISLEKQMIGVGISTIFPTGGDNDATGSGKWQAGPAFVYINLQTKGLQWGALGWHNWSYADTSSGKDKEDVNVSSIQPILTKHFSEGWYLALQDITWNYNHKSNNWTTPIGPRLGRVTKIGEQPVNLFGAVYYDPNDDGPSAKWTAKINLTLLFPK